MTLIKTCGMREPAHAVAAAQAGANYIGMILAPSRRRITSEQASAIVSAVRSSVEKPPKVVGVFVDADPAEVNDTAAAIGLDLVQLSGNEDDEYLEKIALPRIKVIHIDTTMPAPVAWVSLRRRLATLTSLGVMPFVEPQVNGLAGGTGQTFDWDVARGQSDAFDFIMAGGLTPENVGEAIEQAHPWAVDVSSGIETAGVKDVGRIRNFIDAVRMASARRGPSPGDAR